VKLALVPHTNWSARLAAYEADATDFLDLWGFPPVEAERARQRHAGEYVSTPWLFIGYLGFDLSRPPFADERVRRAFALATDRTALANIAMQGYVSPVTGGSIPPGLAGYSAGLGLPYDPNGARQLLAAAGYPGGRGFPTLEAVRPPNPADVILSEALQAQWRAVLGIEVRWQSMSWQQFANTLQRRELQLFHGIFLCNYPDPENCLGWFQHVTGAHLTEFNQLLEQAQHTTDPQQRLQLHIQADHILVEQAGIVPLYYGRLHLLAKPWVKKLPTSLIMAWFWKDMIIEPPTAA
jgi:oligopeptide transport system substrate-binding protein